MTPYQKYLSTLSPRELLDEAADASRDSRNLVKDLNLTKVRLEHAHNQILESIPTYVWFKMSETALKTLESTTEKDRREALEKLMQL